MQSITCLFIDDDTDDHLVFQEILQKISSSIKCLVSFNGKEALEKLRSGLFHPDVIFLDLKMPFMDGIQFLTQRLRHNLAINVPVYLLTDYSNDGKEQALLLGVKEVISKPFSLTEWEICLRKIISNVMPST